MYFLLFKKKIGNCLIKHKRGMGMKIITKLIWIWSKRWEGKQSIFLIRVVLLFLLFLLKQFHRQIKFNYYLNILLSDHFSARTMLQSIYDVGFIYSCSFCNFVIKLTIFFDVRMQCSCNMLSNAYTYQVYLHK